MEANTLLSGCRNSQGHKPDICRPTKATAPRKPDLQMVLGTFKSNRCPHSINKLNQ